VSTKVDGICARQGAAARRPLAAVLLWLCSVALCGPGCVPSRDAPQVRCTNDSFCPSDGEHFCNTSTNLCERCVGPCGSTQSDAGADSGAGVDAAAADTGGGSDDAADDDAADDDTAPEDGAAAQDGSTADDATTLDASVVDADGPATPGSCAGWCGESGVSGDCYCDSTCLSFEDCCDDYLDVCGVGPPGDATATDIDLADDATITGT
jgi:hypothetical protein